jgi:alpha-mannosidase
VLENDVLRVTIDEHGLIRSVLDKGSGREVIAAGGAGNLLQLHPDTPNSWDAWDLDSFYRHRVTDLCDGTVTVEDDMVVVEHAFGESTLRQQVTLHGACVDLTTTVDWHERHTVLKLGLDADVHSDHARYETQFGHVVRPTHVNTTWDAARFEVCAHRWVQVAETGWAVGLANATTYGHDVTRHPREGGGTWSRVRATLLRAPRYPDPETDQGEHTFRHAIVVGGDVAEAAAAGYRLNLPLRGASGGAAVDPIVTVDGPAWVEAVKLAEDGSGDVVVRLYEPLGARARVTVTPGFDADEPRVVDLLERPLDEPWDGTLRPFQILTLRWAPR